MGRVWRQTEERRAPSTNGIPQLGVPAGSARRSRTVRLGEQSPEGRGIDVPADDRVDVVVDEGDPFEGLVDARVRAIAEGTGCHGGGSRVVYEELVA